MKRVAFAIAACSIAACSIGLASAASPAAAAAAKYEAVTFKGTPGQNVGFIQINVATGATLQYWGGGASQFTVVADSTPIPAGDYHLYPSFWADPTGKVSWSLFRLDDISGRTWSASGGGPNPLVWVEITQPK